MFTAPRSFASLQYGGALLLAAATFAAGLSGGALIALVSTSRGNDRFAALKTPQPATAPEPHARCEDEKVKALAARDALARLLAEESVGISRVGQDKYGGRLDADGSTARSPDVSATMLQGGFARRYSGGRRESWCG
jgi:micrococcal nuclease